MQAAVGFLGGLLLGGLDGVVGGRLVGFAVDGGAAFVATAPGRPLLERVDDLECHLPAVFLAPVDEFALEVPVGVGNGVDVDVARDDAVDDYLARETVAFFEVDCADEGLESVAFNGFEYALRLAVVLYQLRQPDVVGEAVEAFAADNLCAQLGEVALALARVAAEQHFGHHRGEERVAEVLEPLVVYAAALGR